jgi:hypothetical protein
MVGLEAGRNAGLAQKSVTQSRRQGNYPDVLNLIFTFHVALRAFFLLRRY